MTLAEELAQARERIAELEAEIESPDAEGDLRDALDASDKDAEERVYVVPSDYPGHRHARDFPVGEGSDEGLPVALPLKDDEVAREYRVRNSRQASYLYRRRVSAWAYGELARGALQEALESVKATESLLESVAASVRELGVDDPEKREAAKAVLIKAADTIERKDPDTEYTSLALGRVAGTLAGALELLEEANEVEYVAKAPGYEVHPEVSKGLVDQAVTFDGYVPRSRKLKSLYARFEKRVGTKFGDGAAAKVAARPSK